MEGTLNSSTHPFLCVSVLSEWDRERGGIRTAGPYSHVVLLLYPLIKVRIWVHSIPQSPHDGLHTQLSCSEANNLAYCSLILGYGCSNLPYSLASGPKTLLPGGMHLIWHLCTYGRKMCAVFSCLSVPNIKRSVRRRGRAKSEGKSTTSWLSPTSFGQTENRIGSRR